MIYPVTGPVEFGGKASHRRDHEMEPLAMEWGGEQRLALDQQNPVGVGTCLGQRADSTVELISEHPDRSTHDSIMAGTGWWIQPSTMVLSPAPPRSTSSPGPPSS